ncbi:MAG: glycosyltransferase family 9 protein, partial [Planctomycetota bacterium]
MSPPRRVLVLRSGALGDFVLTLPVLAALRSFLPYARICYVGRSEFGKLARRSGLADDLLDENRPEVVALYREAPDADSAKEVGIAQRLGRIDLALSFVSSDAVARNLLAAGAREVLSSSVRPPAGGAVHAADHLMSILRGRFDVPARAVPRLSLPEGPRERARRALGERGLDPGSLILLHPGSGSPRKNWPAERFAELAHRARDELGVGIAVALGPAEEERAGELRSVLGPVAAACFDRSPLGLLAGVLSECAGFVGNDSGVTHLAAACGAPTAAVFGPTDPVVWGPRGEHVGVVRD